jgi:hypothetical protein
MQMLSTEEVQQLWPQLEVMLRPACEANEVATTEVNPADILQAVVDGMCVVLAFFKADELGLALVVRFTDTNGHKGAEIIALGGKELVSFKRAYWPFVLDWFRANGCEFVSAYADERLAKIYKTKFGFDKSCEYVRMVL